MERSSNSSSGVAPIKTEFLLQDHVREINLEFVATKDKKRVSNEDNASDSTNPPRKKLKGQNKHRPRNKKCPKSDKLCFKIGTEGSCPFGDKCCYSHDVDTYLSKKPQDINSTCYLFNTYGKCLYSYSCRFASEHIKNGTNLILEELWAKYKDQKLFVNILSKDLQRSLRKREYDFKKSDEILKNFIGTVQFNKGKKQNLESDNSEFHIVPNEQNASVEVKCEEQTATFKNIGDVNKTEGIDSPTLGNSSVVNNNSKILDNENTGILDNLSNKDSIVSPEISNSESILKPDIDVSSKVKDIDILFDHEIKKVDFRNKLYLAPLTTVGNLPFRRICKEYGADITCSEMSVAISLLQGQQSEWALLKRHHTEDLFGIQLCGSHPDVMTRCCQVLSENASFDFIDINMGCPLDAIYKKGAGCGLMNRMKKLEGMVYGVSSVISVPLTLKMRTGIYENERIAHNIIEKIKQWKTPVSLVTLHGRSREQRYTKSADWSYIDTCNKLADPIPLFGNGDILSYEDYNIRRAETGVSGVMIARGALIKPWIFKEIKDQTHWDISSSERFEILKKYTNYGLEHWGSDTEGVEKTRRFMLEWLSFLYRYIPIGLLERVPQRINERPAPYFGRNDLETLMASPSCSDWVKISEMLLGPVPEGFIFLPKHKANAYK
ncbi:tRNA-dihydrouridine(47) synthase-like [Trichonephila inaurata madagascariensis]|uniref:tRNA-dihydrouridine(47) synthase [NAD(P)(+)] n=1 Tax=Trichonephila inaurata madagascariensis TaxID=2747483 RepID=A0A8X6YJA2_9ARAC|nr:tRNA-dihydrouridine(47) synthase-like [Trichonephila inaurata madagascariensis]